MRSSWSASIRRIAAALAIACAVAGAVGLVVSVAALPDPWTHGYVSEAGLSSRGGVYRAAIIALCAAQILLGVAISRSPSAHAGLFLATVLPAALLIAAGGVGSVSAAVSCTPGCPLPPYEHATAHDLIHAGAACTAIGLAALALTAIAALAPPEKLRVTARIAVTIIIPLLAAMMITLLAVGRSTTTAILERLVLATMIAALIAVATRLTARTDRSCG